MAIVLSSCSAQTQQQGGLFEESDPGEVGATHFAATFVMPLAEVEVELQPNFAIDEQSAVAQVAPPTMRGSSVETQISRL